ncbi:bifunctional glycosyltransferase/CDP-glycerol:glycerophosphate glycerophosphotransferase [Bailinhaonella thermotolerans]|uniref:CDP-glycerol:glycerophosphate glycerophosphotransferase n=1 Tax=Bailinhaonella thermotolerans TaxID=1070861 RepID=A0A3A4B636_9ACTN|nr:bifunctional glycosyltransferase family 2 protein/CDP-glycerol:glycerophosphate glycerophosphotransferase [Bailinhaonella thermotolerans]RJL33501.1 CDP-glycerol:glycerophosphate glycerophosphotransferase [Bailinhaonella thermotolerans]
MPRISIVVPVLDGEDALAERLTALADRPGADLEVVVVDRGSADASREVARKFAESDHRVLTVEHPAARTAAILAGVAHASGAYFAFCDPAAFDPEVWEILAGSLDDSASDFAVAAPRFSREGASPREFAKTVLARPIAHMLFRRSAWDRLAPPADVAWFEPALAVRAFARASAVDLVDLSRPAPPAPAEPLGGVMAAVADALRVLRGDERRAYDLHVLTNLLPSYLDAAADGGPERVRELIGLAGPYLKDVHPSVKREVPAPRRLRYHLIEHGLEKEFAELASVKKQPARVRKGLRWYADLPLRGDKRIPDRVFRLEGADLVPKTQVEEVVWDGDRLRLSGWAYLPRMSVRGPRFNYARLVLRGPGWIPPIRVRASRTRNVRATVMAKEAGYNYDWAGFAASVRPFSLKWRLALLRLTGRRDDVSWQVDAVVQSRGASGRAPLRGPAQGQAERPVGRRIGRGTRVRPAWGPDRRLELRIEGARPSLTAACVEGDRLLLTGTLPRSGSGVLELRHHSAKLSYPYSGTTFAASVPLEALTPGAWELRVNPDGDRPRPVIMAAEELVASLVEPEGHELAVLRELDERVSVAVRPYTPLLTSATWVSPGVLELVGRHFAGRGDLVLRHARAGVHAVTPAWDEDRFTVRLTPARMARFGSSVPLNSGTWALYVRDLSGALARVRVDHGELEALPSERVTVDGRRFRVLAVGYDEAVLHAEEDVPDADRGVPGQALLRRSYYPKEREKPLKDAVLYVCWNGKQYSDSVRAVYEELLRRELPLQHVWLVADGAFVPPGSLEVTGKPGVTPTVVRAGSREYYQAMARSKYVVANTYLPKWARIRDDQVMVQTWHGTPLKRIGNDMPWMQRPGPKPDFWHRQAAEVPNWDLLVSQTPWASPIFRRAFGYEGELLECGYPRNDLLTTADASVKAVVRSRLGIPDGKRVVLYAPTWRDYDRDNPSLRLDVDDARRVLGDDHVLLVRGHLMQAGPGLHDPSGFVVDVTSYPDITELMLVSDVLITDYSSVMFDFASTRRPMLFFTYDLARYRDSTRGFYFDFEAEAPGPLLATSEAVVSALRDLATAGPAAPDARYEAFIRKYCPYDDGQAAARLVTHVFGP